MLSCNKDKQQNSPGTVFYGRWKTSYGDTITFYRSGSKDLLEYDVSLSPGPVPSPIVNQEYTFSNNKLGIKNGLNGPDNYTFFQTFRWIQPGESFEVQGVEWFLFISSTLTWFTFTKIP